MKNSLYILIIGHKNFIQIWKCRRNFNKICWQIDHNFWNFATCRYFMRNSQPRQQSYCDVFWHKSQLVIQLIHTFNLIFAFKKSQSSFFRYSFNLNKWKHLNYLKRISVKSLQQIRRARLNFYYQLRRY